VVDGTEGLPGGWPNPLKQTIRYNCKQADAEGIVRTDCVFCGIAYTPVSEPVVYGFGFAGYFVDYDETEQKYYMPHMGVWEYDPKPLGNEVSCGRYTFDFTGCNTGDWYMSDDLEYVASEELLDAGWAVFEFYKGILGGPYWTKEKFAEGTRYWTPDWPYWALLLCERWDWPFIAIDFVDESLPE
jgi:hypothetical protein